MATSNTDWLLFSSIGYLDTVVASTLLYGVNSVKLLPDFCVLKELVVEAPSRSMERLSDVSAKVVQVNQEDIEFFQGQTSADILEKSGEVYVQRSQMGGGSPVLRGMEANRVLLVLDGVRLNNAIYRSGHLQNSITVDPSILESAEVLFGPSAIMYGSDALGGVVHYKTKTPLLTYTDSVSNVTNASLRFSSANFEKKLHIDWEHRRKKMAVLTSLTAVDYEDLRTGTSGWKDYDGFGDRTTFVDSYKDVDTIVMNENPHVQVGTKYAQVDLLNKVRYQPNEYLDFILTSSYSTSTNVPRYDRLIEATEDGELKFAEWDYGPQLRLMNALTIKGSKPKKMYDQFSWVGAFQKINEERINRRYKSQIRSTQKEAVYVLSLNGDFQKRFNNSHKLLYGIEANFNIVHSIAFNEGISDNVLDFDRPTRYPDGGSLTKSLALYVNHRWDISERHRLVVGLRGAFSSVAAAFEDTSRIKLPFDEIDIQDNALTWSVGYNVNLLKGWKTNVSASTAYRSPNVDDFGKVRAKDGVVSVPNDSLTSERSFNADWRISKDFGWARMQLSSYATLINDAIVREKFSLDGDTLLYIEGEENRVIANVNAGQAYILGGSFSTVSKISRHYLLKAGVTYTYGYNKSDNVPLGHIPPLYGYFELEYNKHKFRTNALVRFNGWKTLSKYEPGEESADNLSSATIDGTPAWATVNWYAQYALTKHLQFSGGVENILDQRYRSFASGVNAPGRNLILSIKATF